MLSLVDAIARAVDAKKGGGIAARIAEVETYLNVTFGLVVPADIKNTEPSPTTDSFFDLDPKHVIEPICKNFGIKKYDIAKQMSDAEIFDDVKTLINEIISMCR